ncbi:aspartate--tRNA ligase [Atopococcus tabaci]|uniref:aspartate--tRNA ligase n=1 Tax=Atopococcus tabaci TaxID=269774 RepID=UPI0024098836|nr:aspartate--tRNA ligase [Atopococcus tabaci]
MKRTNYCGLVSKEYEGQTVVLKGWVQKRRDLGGMIFLDLRDREGIVQVVVNQDVAEDAWKIADTVRSEFVLEVEGKVIPRQEGAVNPNVKTGEIEVEAHHIAILSRAKTPPFDIVNKVTVSDDIRHQYRYLDLRRPKMAQNLILRHATTRSIREFLDQHGFIDTETPYLTKSTPEGARDYLVPSRVHQGKFYALPQSPQLFKQLLMGAGLDRYYQIVRCFRDEDLRGDRQPEFTQVDIETSFLGAEDIQEMMEEMLQKVLKDTLGVDVAVPFPRISYDEAMNKYGTDKPDLRFGMELVDVSSVVADSDFKVFAGAVQNGGTVRALNVKGAADDYSRKQIDELAEHAAVFGAKGLAWLKVTEEGFTGPIAKFFKEEEISSALAAQVEAEAGDLLLFVADKTIVAQESLGALRSRLGKERNLIDSSEFAFAWIVDWPLFEYNEDERRFQAAHHPFTMPQEKDVPLLETEPEKVYAQAYDVVLNGYELGGGSIRIHQRDLQEKMFRALGFSKEEYEEQFGFLLNALDQGFPPHGGIALGLDRFVMLLAGEENIREVMAFPKNNSAIDPLTKAPNTVSDKQLDELRLAVVEEEPKTEE